ncbi:redoxin domain-containing protein [Mangrovactinospora gilvigrisea]|uniref:Redoxin domain-containing protein n=1 Tax=Mangrovactinospora gilvigrisea TaxID=1428644 RepID=A0A1J7CBX5_9ACTN|nr:TlpA disulfide reductase family protein [Mangrovactinospora gilvigrisea]OIV39012.1 redoxin domain-containing protein [Mangrovactinospora gilvigrisea]
MSVARSGSGASRARLRTPACLAALGAAAALLLSACASSGSSGSSSSGDTSGFPKGTGEVTRIAAGKRAAAPDIGGKTLDGKSVKLSDYRGKVVVLNVWGSWCAPCRKEAPVFAKVSRSEAKNGVQFLGLNTRDTDLSQPRAFEKDFGIAYPSIQDEAGNLILRFKGNLPPQTIPSTLVIDRRGRIAVRALVELTSAQQLAGIIDPVAKEKA